MLDLYPYIKYFQITRMIYSIVQPCLLINLKYRPSACFSLLSPSLSNSIELMLAARMISIFICSNYIEYELMYICILNNVYYKKKYKKKIK